jgi:hypothetical protein
MSTNFGLASEARSRNLTVNRERQTVNRQPATRIPVERAFLLR